MKKVVLVLIALTTSSLAQAAQYTCAVTGSTTRSYMKSGIDVTSNDSTSTSGTVVTLDRVGLDAHIDIRNNPNRPGYQDVSLRLTKIKADPAPGDDVITGLTLTDEKNISIGASVGGQLMGMDCQGL